MKALFLAVIATFNLSTFAATSLITCSGEFEQKPYSVLPYVRDADAVAIGDAVEIRTNESHEIMSAYFLGIKGEKAYFTSETQPGLRRPMFYLPKNSVDFIREQRLKGNEIVVTPLVAQTVPRFDVSDNEDNCAPLTVMACLSHLERDGYLSALAKSTLGVHRMQLLKEMEARLDRKSTQDSPEGERLLREFDNAPNWKAKKIAMENMRAFFFKRITKFLADLDVKSEGTTSYRALIRHLQAGKPAYISVSGMSLGSAQPSLDRWNADLPWDDPDIHSVAFPSPLWSPNYAGFHSVYALGVLPRAPGLRGLQAGARVIILDPGNGHLNIWNTLALRFARTPKFILIGD